MCGVWECAELRSYRQVSKWLQDKKWNELPGGRTTTELHAEYNVHRDRFLLFVSIDASKLCLNPYWQKQPDTIIPIACYNIIIEMLVPTLL